jgi:cell division transport system ATP-binding protein
MAGYATRTLRIEPGKFADSHGGAQPPEAGAGRAAPGHGQPGETA